MSATAERPEPVIPLVPSDEERLLREAVGGITSGYGAKYMLECTEAGEPPTELWDALAEKGYCGVNLPEEFGGGGLGMTGLAAVQEELALQGCTQLLLVVSPAIAGSILVARGSREQQEEWLPGLARGTTRIAFAVTEPDAGTNTHNISTRAKQNGDGSWVLKGQKTYISGVEHATHILIVARQELDDGQLGLPLLFIVDVDAPGLNRESIPMALRLPDKQWTLYIDGIEVADERLIGGTTGGLGALFDGLNPERIMAAAGSIGAGDRALRQASEYARERAVWGKPIGTHQGLSHPLAQCKVELELARRDDAEGLRALRRRLQGRGRGVEHGQVRGGRGGGQVRRSGDPDPRRQRHRARVRAHRHVVGSAAQQDRPGEPRDDPQLRRRALAGPAQELLRATGHGPARSHHKPCGLAGARRRLPRSQPDLPRSCAHGRGRR